jgi:hypothetical protein
MLNVFMPNVVWLSVLAPVTKTRESLIRFPPGINVRQDDDGLLLDDEVVVEENSAEKLAEAGQEEPTRRDDAAVDAALDVDVAKSLRLPDVADRVLRLQPDLIGGREHEIGQRPSSDKNFRMPNCVGRSRRIFCSQVRSFLQSQLLLRVDFINILRA